MPRKSYAALQNDLLNLQRRYYILSQDKDFDVLTRDALNLSMQDYAEAESALILYVYKSPSMEALRRILHTKHPGILTVARWHEKAFIFIVSHDAESLFSHLQRLIVDEISVKAVCFGVRITDMNPLHNAIPNMVNDAEIATNRILKAEQTR